MSLGTSSTIWMACMIASLSRRIAVLSAYSLYHMDFSHLLPLLLFAFDRLSALVLTAIFLNIVIPLGLCFLSYSTYFLILGYSHTKSTVSHWSSMTLWNCGNIAVDIVIHLHLTSDHNFLCLWVNRMMSREFNLVQFFFIYKPQIEF